MAQYILTKIYEKNKSIYKKEIELTEQEVRAVKIMIVDRQVHFPTENPNWVEGKVIVKKVENGLQ